MNEPTNEQIRHALEQAERRAYEAGEPFNDEDAHALVASLKHLARDLNTLTFNDEDAHALVARLVARSERQGRQRKPLPVDDLLAGLDDADACSA